jgi:REP element-mobilizing transposase RayT
MLGVPMNRTPLTKRQYLRELVYEKNKWDEPLSDADKAKGFLGWHERGYLPHCDKPGLVQLVTLRLVDSLPASRRGEWEHLLAIEDVRERTTQLESYLDRGVGECWLRDARVAELVEEAMRFHHGQRYELLAWCVMPNHVHVIVHVWDWPLAKMLQNWKSITAVKANRILGRSGSFWQREYWDTFTRDEAQERTAVRYIENNPVKANLCRSMEDWRFNAARFRDRFRLLIVPDRMKVDD